MHGSSEHVYKGTKQVVGKGYMEFILPSLTSNLSTSTFHTSSYTQHLC